jgi:galactitol PTS system EIIA component
MSQTVIFEDCIYIEPKVEPYNSGGVIGFLCDRLVEKGFINSTYLPSVIKREEKYPTGLPTLPYAVAIPHAENKGVNKTVIALAVLNKPVKFMAMDSPKKELDVRLVLLMAVADSSTQVSMLRWIARLMQDKNVITQLVLSKNPKEVISVLTPMIHDVNI